MSSRRKAARESDEKDKEDELAQKVDMALRLAGANERGIHHHLNEGPTMRELLNQYTQYRALTEVDEHGEHPLFPLETSRNKDRNRSGRNNRLQSVGGYGGNQSWRGLTGPVSVSIGNLLRRMDNDRWPTVKYHFQSKGGSLDRHDFVSMLRSNLGHIPGCEEQDVTEELRRVHSRLCQNLPVTDGPSATEAENSGNVQETEEGEDEELMHVSWTMFTKLLLDLGIVKDMVHRFNVVEILSHIDLDKIGPLKDEFMRLGNALDLDLFVAVMRSQFHYVFELVTMFELRSEERQLVAQFIELFEVVDINCNNVLSWGEFTAFLVDKGMSEDIPKAFNNIRLGESSVVDETPHQSQCEKAIYLNHYDKIAYIEQGSRVVKLLSPDLTLYHELQDFKQVPLYVTYIEKEGLLAVSCSDLTIAFYDASSGLKLARRILSHTAQLVMCWSNTAHVLFTADHEGSIFAWDVAAIKLGAGRSSSELIHGEPSRDFLKPAARSDERPRGKDDRPAPWARHTDIGSDGKWIMPTPRSGISVNKAKGNTLANELGRTIVLSLLELEVLGLLASAGIDGTVMLWDTFTGMPKTTLRGHNLGVRCMAFVAANKVLVTGGHDYMLMVWNPYVGSSIHSMKGHVAQITGIEVLGAASDQIVSADADGVIKIWDLGTYQCFQTINVGGIMRLRAFVSIPGHKRILVADRKLIAYDYLNTGAPDQTDEYPIIKAMYIPRLRVFISACSTHLRVWDAVSGAIKCVIEHPDTEITDFCVDGRGRKAFVADHLGAVKVYNTTTGCEIRKLTAHKQEISGMIYCPEDSILMTVGWDRTLKVHDDSERSRKILREATNLHAGDVTCIAFSRRLGLIATGATDCVIALREFTRLRSISFLLGHKADITALTFVDPLPLLISADSNGNVAVWAIPQPTGQNHRYVNEVLTRFMNMQSLESAAAVNCMATVYTEAEPEQDPGSPTATTTFMTGVAHTQKRGRLLVYTGDEDGDARLWDLSKLLEVADIGPCPGKKEWDARKGAEVDCTNTTETMSQRAMSMSQAELPTRILEPVVKQVHSWSAHTDSMRSICVYDDPGCILTAGYDQTVRIWTLEGQLLTVLRAYGQTPWNFPVKVDAIGIDEATLDGILQRAKEYKLEAIPDEPAAISARASRAPILPQSGKNIAIEGPKTAR